MTSMLAKDSVPAVLDLAFHPLARWDHGTGGAAASFAVHRFEGCPTGDEWAVHHDDVCYLTVLYSETLPWDVSVAPGAGLGAPPLLSKPDLNMPVVDQSEDAIYSSPAPVADVVAVDSLSAMGSVVALSSLPDLSLKEVPNSLSLDSVALDEVLRDFSPVNEADEYISDSEFQEKSMDNVLNLSPHRTIALKILKRHVALRSKRLADRSAASLSTFTKMRVSMDRRYEYAVVVRVVGVDIDPVIGGEAGGFSFTDV
eukprot:IDg10094t1